MDESGRRQAEELFHELADLPTEDRLPFLDRAAASGEVRREVESLLSHLHQHSVASLDQVEARTAPALVGERLGPYRILELIGEGGFGSVYLAEQQEPIQRRVALKVIKLGMDTEQVIARFAVERHALELMDHPGIARVLDAGATDSGRPYFVMEFVHGSPITEFCRRRNLDLCGRLQLFIRVCLAVQHAHQKGMIHRDIKATNVLVTEQDGAPVAKVIDFGIARAIDRRHAEQTLLTANQQLVGTPEYMSPEQAGIGSSDIDTRTDIYSLGVLLYELLTGRTPFDRRTLRDASYAEVQRIIREVTPPLPSVRISQTPVEPDPAVRAERTPPPTPAHKVRGDLDWIVMKALEKDPDRRYATAADLAVDVRRHLDREPVRARPPSALYQMQRFAARHRVGVVAGLITAVALLVGLGLAIAGFVKAERANAALAVERDTAEANAATAKQQTARAHRVTAFLQQVLAAVNPSRTLGRTANLRSALDAAVKQLEQGALADDPEAAAEVHLTIGHTFGSLGRYRQALTHLLRSAALRRRSAAPDDEKQLHTKLLIGNVQLRLGRLTEALDTLHTAIDVLEATVGPDDPQTLGARDLLASTLWRSGRIDQARALQERNLEAARRIHGEEAAETLRYTQNHATLCGEHGDRKDRLRAARTLTRILRTYQLRSGDRHPDTLETINMLGVVLAGLGKAERAESLYREALEGLREVVGADHTATRLCRNNLIMLLHAQHRLEESRPLVEEMLEVRRRAADAADASARDLQRLAWILLTAVPADLRDLPRALELAESAVARTDGRHPACLRTLAFACHWNGAPDRAIAVLAQAVAAAPGTCGTALDFGERHLLDWLSTRRGTPGALEAAAIIATSRSRGARTRPGDATRRDHAR